MPPLDLPQGPIIVLAAYIDPGAGYLLLQMIIGAAVGGWLFFRQGIRRALRAVAGTLRPKDGREGGEQSAEEVPPL